MSAVCAINWAAFGLDPALEPACDQPATFTVAQACVHEHVARSSACYGCMAAIVQYGEPGEWWCDQCRIAGHVCPAPLQAVEL
jgi:hypothetical protein